MSAFAPQAPGALTSGTVCLTGYSGFFGRHVLHALVAQGIRPFLIGRPRREQAPTSSADLAQPWCSPAELAAQIRALPDPVVINISGLISSNHAPEDIPFLVSANVEYPVQIFEAAALAADKRIDEGGVRLINIGTTREVSGIGKPYPVNLYGHLKATNARILAWYASRHPLRAVNLKVTDSYGLQDEREALVPFLRRCWRDGTEAALRYRAQRINLAHMTDVTEGILAAALASADVTMGHAETQVLMGPDTVTIGAMVDALQDEIAPGLQARFADTREVVPGLADVWTDAPGIPGWQPRVPLLAGLRDVFGSPAPRDPL
jgi:nucleoside-diphosphate-sugar epimerase